MIKDGHGFGFRDVKRVTFYFRHRARKNPNGMPNRCSRSGSCILRRKATVAVGDRNTNLARNAPTLRSHVTTGFLRLPWTSTLNEQIHCHEEISA